MGHRLINNDVDVRFQQALELIGKPFENGGRGPDKYDCWGLCCEVYRIYGLKIPDYQVYCYDSEKFNELFIEESPSWVKYFYPEDAPIPSIVAFRVSSRYVNHAGIYIGNGKFLHTREKTGVVIERLDAPQWRHRLEGLYAPENNELYKLSNS